MKFNEFNKLSVNKQQELYNDFICDWQNEYGPRPEEYVPDTNSIDFEYWLLNELTQC